MALRNSTAWLMSVAVVVLAVAVVAAQEQAQPEQARTRAAERTRASRAVQPEPAPVPVSALTYVLSEAHITGTVSTGGVAELTAEVTGTSFVDDWVSIPVFRTPVAVTDYEVRRGDRKTTFLIRTDTGYDLAVGKKGDFALRIYRDHR